MTHTSSNHVRDLPGNRLLIEIDRRVRNERGVVERTRIRRRMPAGTSRQEAEAIAQRLAHGIIVRAAAVDTTDGWAEYVNGLAETKGSWLYVTLKNSQHRSRERGLECFLTAQQIKQVMLRSGGRCEVTGLRFHNEKSDGQRVRPFFHSLDRIDSALGYTIDNLRLVCHAANIAMNAWGEDVFAELARGFVFNRYSAFYASQPGSFLPPTRAANSRKQA